MHSSHFGGSLSSSPGSRGMGLPKASRLGSSTKRCPQRGQGTMGVRMGTAKSIGFHLLPAWVPPIASQRTTSCTKAAKRLCASFRGRLFPALASVAWMHLPQLRQGTSSLPSRYDLHVLFVAVLAAKGPYNPHSVDGMRSTFPLQVGWLIILQGQRLS
jgi:hypothetical protein